MAHHWNWWKFTRTGTCTGSQSLTSSNNTMQAMWLNTCAMFRKWKQIYVNNKKCHAVPHPTDRQKAAASLSAELELIRCSFNKWGRSFNPGSLAVLLGHSRRIIGWIYIYLFLWSATGRGFSLELLHLTISQDLSWADHIARMASKASQRLGTPRRYNSFLANQNYKQPPRLLSIA